MLFSSDIQDSIPHWQLWAAFIVLICIASTLWTGYGTPLRKIPGPTMARFTRLFMVSKALQFDAHVFYRRMHDRYGKIVRIAPNKVLVADPAMIPVIYKIGTKFEKVRPRQRVSRLSRTWPLIRQQSSFYDSFRNLYKGEFLENMFATRKVQHHKQTRSNIASAYSLNNLKQLEPLVDECSSLFLNAMYDLANQPVDLGKWVQWYAFDVIGMISFHRSFGFLERREDRNGIINKLEVGAKYSTIIGQVPFLHQYLLGSKAFLRLMKTSENSSALDPLPTIDMVGVASKSLGSVSC